MYNEGASLARATRVIVHSEEEKKKKKISVCKKGTFSIRIQYALVKFYYDSLLS